MTIIAVDGSSATGKGTLCLRLAQTFDYAYLDTGALYRGVAYELVQNGQSLSDEAAAISVAQGLTGAKMLHLQDESVIRTESCGKNASMISSIPGVRQALYDFQRRFALNPIRKDGKSAQGAILDGRDIGTVICPDADFKLFLTARAEIRAERRLKELQSKGLCVIYEDVLSDIVARDRRDSERKTAPLKPAEDALIIDTSDLTADEVYARVVRYIKGRE